MKSKELSRGLDTRHFQTIRSRDDLTRNNVNDSLVAGRKRDDLMRSEANDNLSFNRNSDDLSRGNESTPLGRCD